MTIKQLLEMPIDKEKSMCGGFQLTVKRARSTRKVDGKIIQEVEWSDATGEMPGDVLMPNPKQCSSLTRVAIINVVVCWLQLRPIYSRLKPTNNYVNNCSPGQA